MSVKLLFSTFSAILTFIVIFCVNQPKNDATVKNNVRPTVQLAKDIDTVEGPADLMDVELLKDVFSLDLNQ